MTDIPTEAVEAAAVTLCRDLIGSTHDGSIPCEGCRSDAGAIVAAAAPFIEARATDDLRTRIEALRDEWSERTVTVMPSVITPASTERLTWAAAADALDALIGGA